MMKRFTAVLLTVAVLFSFPFTAKADDSMEFTRKTEEINIRDPFVLAADGLYYMYGTGAAHGKGYGCYVSRDLELWAGPYNVFSAPSDFDGIKDFWAPECHYYNGSYYLFATYFSASTNHRGVSVFRADSPLGPFEEISDGHITSPSGDYIDGTLYVDEDGQPWMIVVHEWTSTDDGKGRMDAVKLSDDLTHFTSEPVELFKSTDPVWTDSMVTDGPFMYKTKYGKLVMLWSNSCNTGGYSVGLARSSDGTPTGRWTQQSRMIYKRGGRNVYDGGHGMLFETFDGRLLMCIHSPNGKTDGAFERATFIEMHDTGYSLITSDAPGIIIRIADFFSEIFFRISNLWK